MSKEVKKGAHKAIQDRLRRESDKGMVSFTGPHKGRYKAKDGSESKEGSYIVKPGNHRKARTNFHRILKSVGKQFDQESVLKGTKKGGAFHYQDSKTDSQGKIRYNRYNRHLKKGRGDTKLKGKSNSSFSFGSDNDED
jgi:hypothetical protein